MNLNGGMVTFLLTKLIETFSMKIMFKKLKENSLSEFITSAVISPA